MTLAVETAAPERMQRRELSERAFAWALIAPALLFIAVIVVWPLAETIRLSFTDATLGKDLKTVTLVTTPQPADTALTLTVAGLRDIQTGVAAAPAAVTVDPLPAEIAADAGALASGYRVVYTLDIPVYSDSRRT